MRSYVVLFSFPGYSRLAVAAVLSRVSTSMLSLSLAVAVSTLSGSLADAGLILTVHALATAVGSPCAGRLADRFGPRPVLVGYLLLHALASGALITVLLQGAPITLIAVAVGAVGASAPPSSAVLRGHWPTVVPPERLPTAYAFDSVLNSTTFIAGPLAAGLLIAVSSPTVAVITATLAKLSGDTLLVTIRDLTRATRTRASGIAGLLGPMANAQVRLVLAVVTLDTFTYGCLAIAAVAAGDGHGSLAGMLMAGLAAGEVAGGLAYGARPWPGTIRRQLVMLHLGTAAVLVMTSMTSTVVLIAVLYLAAGLTSGARDALNQVALTHSAAPDHRVESFAWLGTFMWLGYAAGTHTAGTLQELTSTPAVYLAAAAAAVLAAICATRLRQSAAVSSW